MNKVLFILFVSLVILMNGLTFCIPQDFDNRALDDLERSIKNMERTMKQDSLKDLQLKQKQQYPSLKPPIDTFPSDLSVGDKPATDRAIIKNQERWKEMMDGPKTSLSEGLSDWQQDIKIPKKYRLLIELFVIALFLNIVTFLLYRRKIKSHKKEEGGRSKEEIERDKAKAYISSKNIDKFI